MDVTQCLLVHLKTPFLFPSRESYFLPLREQKASLHMDSGTLEVMTCQLHKEPSSVPAWFHQEYAMAFELLALPLVESTVFTEH